MERRILKTDFEKNPSAIMQRCYIVARSFLRSPHDAEDVASMSYMKVLKRIGTYNPASSFQSWVDAIAANTSRDYLSSEKFRRKHEINLSALSGTSNEEVPCDAMDLRADSENLLDCLASREDNENNLRRLRNALCSLQ